MSKYSSRQSAAGLIQNVWTFIGPAAVDPGIEVTDVGGGDYALILPTGNRFMLDRRDPPRLVNGRLCSVSIKEFEYNGRDLRFATRQHADEKGDLVQICTGSDHVDGKGGDQRVVVLQGDSSKVVLASGYQKDEDGTLLAQYHFLFIKPGDTVRVFYRDGQVIDFRNQGTGTWPTVLTAEEVINARTAVCREIISGAETSIGYKTAMCYQALMLVEYAPEDALSAASETVELVLDVIERRELMILATAQRLRDRMCEIADAAEDTELRLRIFDTLAIGGVGQRQGCHIAATGKRRERQLETSKAGPAKGRTGEQGNVNHTSKAFRRKQRKLAQRKN